MSTIIRTFADLHLLRDDLAKTGVSVELTITAAPDCAAVMATEQVPDLAPLREEDPAASPELDTLLTQYNLWLGYTRACSRTKWKTHCFTDV